MRKELAILTLILGLGKGIDSYTQTQQDSIPQFVKEEVAKYLEHVSYCNNIKIEKVGEKTEDRDGDGIKEKVFGYNVEGCESIPNYFIFTYKGLKEGGFSEISKCETKSSWNFNTNPWKTIPLKIEDL